MSTISNDHEMKTQLDALDPTQQRLVGARLVESVLDLSKDERIQQALKTALDPTATDEQLKAALKSANQATLEGHTRCGAAGDWTDQANYFVGRALVACLTPQVRKEGKNPAWQAALSCRMARTSAAIDQDSDNPLQENTRQYVILSSQLDNR